MHRVNWLGIATIRKNERDPFSLIAGLFGTARPDTQHSRREPSEEEGDLGETERCVVRIQAILYSGTDVSRLTKEEDDSNRTVVNYHAVSRASKQVQQGVVREYHMEEKPIDMSSSARGCPYQQSIWVAIKEFVPHPHNAQLAEIRKYWWAWLGESSTGYGTLVIDITQWS